jgi:aminoglycoside phosphotransferase (APT) family kinase protein
MKEGADSRSAATDSAKWLAALHRCGLTADEAQPDANPVWNWANDLASIQRFEAGRIHRIAQAILRELAKPVSGRVPCHGDFHPMNIFIANERVTGIDIDKFALREPESDVAWFLMQTAAQDFFKNRSFDCTEEARQTFVETYEAEIGRPIRPQRVGLYMAMAFLKNLHFELVLLKTGRNEYAQPWLRGAAAALLEGNLHLAS